MIAVGSSRNDILLFDRRTGALATRVVVRAHSGDVGGLAVDPTSPSFATAGDDKSLRFWCTRRHTLLGVAELPAAGRAVHPLCLRGSNAVSKSAFIHASLRHNNG